MMKLSDIFDVFYGVNLELINCEIDSKNGIPFVSRTSDNNGIVAYVKTKKRIAPNPAGSISCAGGGSVLSAFVQEKEYYSGRDLYILNPKDKKMTIEEKLWYCFIISKNKYRYSYGRQANKTFKDIEIPDEILNWVTIFNLKNKIENIKSKINISQSCLNISNWKTVMLIDYFFMKPGKYFYKSEYNEGKIPYISASDKNNGVSYFSDLMPIFKGNSITIGKIGATTYYQPDDFSATSDVTILIPKMNFNKYIGLFIVTILNKEKFKWYYGRQIRLEDCKKLTIRLPIKKNEPDWEFMENYIKSLPCSDRI